MKDSQTPDSNLEEGFYGAVPYTPDPDDAEVQKQTCYRKTDNIKNRRWRTDSLRSPTRITTVVGPIVSAGVP